MALFTAQKIVLITLAAAVGGALLRHDLPPNMARENVTYLELADQGVVWVNVDDDEGKPLAKLSRGRPGLYTGLVRDTPTVLHNFTLLFAPPGNDNDNHSQGSSWILTYQGPNKPEANNKAVFTFQGTGDRLFKNATIAELPTNSTNWWEVTWPCSPCQLWTVYICPAPPCMTDGGRSLRPTQGKQGRHWRNLG